MGWQNSLEVENGPIRANRLQNRNSELAIAALLETRTLEEAAQRCGLSLSTLKRLLADAEFQKRFKAAKKQALADALEELKGMANLSNAALRSILLDPSESGAAKVSASRLVYDVILKLRELDIDERLTALEEAAELNRPDDLELPPHLRSRR